MRLSPENFIPVLMLPPLPLGEGTLFSSESLIPAALQVFALLVPVLVREHLN